MERLRQLAPSHGIGVSPDNKTLWVDSSIANAVFAYSLPDLKVLGYVQTGEVPDWLTFTPDGAKALRRQLRVEFGVGHRHDDSKTSGPHSGG